MQIRPRSTTLCLALALSTPALVVPPDAWAQDPGSQLAAGPQRAAAAPPELMDPLLRYALDDPEFGGLYVAEDGVVVVVSVRPGAIGEDRRRLATDFGVTAADEVRVALGEYRYLDLVEWRDRLAPVAFVAPGVVFLDVDERRNRLVVGVERVADGRALLRRARGLGIPSSAVLLEQTASLDPLSKDLGDPIRPLLPGLGIFRAGFAGQECTIGFNTAGRSFVTASHCTRIPGSFDGSLFQQSGDPRRVGIELFDPGFFSGGTCPSGRLCRLSDAVRVLATTTSALAGGVRTAFPAPIGSDAIGSRDVVGYFAVVRSDRAVRMGDVVHKVGAATGWSRGTVDKTCVHFGFPRSQGDVLLCQTTVEGFADQGDSGGPVYTAVDDETMALQGILSGGSRTMGFFAYSPLRQVELELGPLELRGTGRPFGRPRPDLVPERSGSLGGPTDFCRLSPDGDLIVRVRNPTNVDVFIGTETAVVFGVAPEPEVAFLPTPPIPAGTFVDVEVPIPPSCLTGGCGFLIALDASLEVDEREGREIDRHELDNLVRGHCVF